MNAINKFLKDNRGSFSILFVVLIFIGVMVVTFFVDMMRQTYTLQEVQSIMDTASVSALRTGVDETKLRVQIFDVDKNTVENSYKRLVTNLIDESSNISDFRFTRTKVETFTENWGTGETTKSRPQALLDSSMIITVESSPILDMIPGVEETFYDSRGGSNFEVNYMGRTQDGKVELAIRSVSRIVYR